MLQVENIALSTKCDSSTNKAMQCNNDDWRVRGRGNSPSVKQHLADGGQTRGSSALRNEQRGQQPLICGGVEAQVERDNLSLRTKPKNTLAVVMS